MTFPFARQRGTLTTEALTMASVKQETRLWNSLRKHYKPDPKIYLWKVHGGPYSANNGFPDVGVVSGGRAMFVELKTKAGVIEPIQIETMRDIASKGGCPCCVCRSLDEAVAAIELWRTGVDLKGMAASLAATSGGEWVWPDHDH